MKTAKSYTYKFIMLVVACVMALVAGVCLITAKNASADTTSTKPLVNDYYKYDIVDGVAEFVNDNAKFTLSKIGDADNDIEIKKEVIVDNFLLNYKIGEGVKSITVKISTDSYFVNGNEKKVDGKTVSFDKTIVNEIKITALGEITFNGELLTDTAQAKPTTINNDTIIFSTENGIANVKAYAGDKEYARTETDAYYKVKATNEYTRLAGKVAVDVEFNDDATNGVFEIISLSQEANKVVGGDAQYLQTYVLDSNNVISEAYPAVSLSEELKVVSGKVLISEKESIKINYSVYSFLSGYTKGKTVLKIRENDGWCNEDGNGNVHLIKGERVAYIKESEGDNPKTFLTINFNVADKDVADTIAPKYVEGQDRVQALKAFEYALKQQYLKEDGKYAVIGSTISLPSFKDLVFDNNTAYEKLTYEVKYATPSSSSFSSSSSLVINLSKEGDYVFYVMFKDVDGNAMDEDLFVKEQDGVKIINNDADAYGQFVFKFHIENNADIEIIPAKVQGKGFKGIRYTASNFKIDASGCTITYKLFYNPDSDATKDSSGWVEIPSFKSVEDDTDYYLNGYSYEDLKSINYDGEVKFTPNKIGAYRIDCTASSNMTVQEVTESSEIIKIAEEKVVVRPGNNWLKNNAWSVVFLSVGSLCLVGIIVLLCVKPKEERKKKK